MAGQMTAQQIKYVMQRVTEVESEKIMKLPFSVRNSSLSGKEKLEFMKSKTSIMARATNLRDELMLGDYKNALKLITKFVNEK